MTFSKFPSSPLSLAVRRASGSSPSVLASPPRIGRLPTSGYLATIILYIWVRGPRFSALIVSDIFTSLRQVLPGRAGTSETRKTTPLLNRINHECSEINPQFSGRFRLLGLALAIDRDSLTSQGNSKSCRRANTTRRSPHSSAAKASPAVPPPVSYALKGLSVNRTGRHCSDARPRSKFSRIRRRGRDPLAAFHPNP